MAGRGSGDLGPRHRPRGRSTARAQRRQQASSASSLLLGLLAAITAAGIAIGRSFAPSSTVATTPPVTTTPAVTVPPPPPPVHVVHLDWGPAAGDAVREVPAGREPGGGRRGRADARRRRRGGERPGARRPGRREARRDRRAHDAARGDAGVPVGRLPLPPRRRERDEADRPALPDRPRRRPGPPGREPSRSRSPRPASRRSGDSAYLVGGWTGSQFATAVLKFTPPGTTALVARLPDGTRSPAVALLGHTLYVAGGRTEQGLTPNVYAIDIQTAASSASGSSRRPSSRPSSFPPARASTCSAARPRTARPRRPSIRIDPATGNPTAVGQ